jgi:predicted O-methyltransferase YrrM
MQVLEWGAGGSTLFFLERGCHLTSVESSAEWTALLEAEVRTWPKAAEERLRLLHADTSSAEGARAFLAPVRARASWDLVLVDCLDSDHVGRVDCVRAALDRVQPGGLIVLDDAWFAELASVPEEAARHGYSRTIFRGLGPARWGVTQTDLYVREGAKRPALGSR